MGNKQDPLDELIFIILSQMTTGPSYLRVFDRLRAAISDWNDLIDMPLRQLKSVIGDAGLSGQKGPRLKRIVERLQADFGEATLAPLKEKSNKGVESYLAALPGVGTKTAKCVMLFSLGRRVLPVDTHLKRLLTRIGLIAVATSNGDVHRMAERAVAPADRLMMHVNGLVHGRRVCRAIRPLCGQCALTDLCSHYRVARHHTT